MNSITPVGSIRFRTLFLVLISLVVGLASVSAQSRGSGRGDRGSSGSKHGGWGPEYADNPGGRDLDRGRVDSSHRDRGNRGSGYGTSRHVGDYHRRAPVYPLYRPYPPMGPVYPVRRSYSTWTTPLVLNFPIFPSPRVIEREVILECESAFETEIVGPVIGVEESSDQLLEVWLDDRAFLLEDGEFFRRGSEGLVWVPTPVGALVSKLPIGMRTVWHEEDEYLEFDGAYFRRSPDGFKVVNPPWLE